MWQLGNIRRKYFNIRFKRKARAARLRRGTGRRRLCSVLWLSDINKFPQGRCLHIFIPVDIAQPSSVLRETGRCLCAIPPLDLLPRSSIFIWTILTFCRSFSWRHTQYPSRPHSSLSTSPYPPRPSPLSFPSTKGITMAVDWSTSRGGFPSPSTHLQGLFVPTLPFIFIFLPDDVKATVPAHSEGTPGLALLA
ncbi:hypothetical protein E2C01_063606 [Portunus trituberculatus]|uniref:Uncharacterized protein n=1 Tax=Portunus trituberculatus TaxID=210409 RepID=A0A5B7HGT6_PORTR|nr:hypothetical protein [Portunus trituberculatus]